MFLNCMVAAMALCLMVGAYVAPGFGRPVMVVAVFAVMGVFWGFVAYGVGLLLHLG